MAKCWTCGSSVSDICYRCSACEDALRDIESSLSEGLANLAEIQERGFNQLSAGLSEISSILEWGFEELSWQLQQQTEVLRSIDHTLKTPSETKANEWRLHAEELRRRGVLEESEEFFLKALNEYRLDYRIYVGLAETYLQINKFDKAKTLLEKSLPHAPKGRVEILGGTGKSEKNLPPIIVGRIYRNARVVDVFKKLGVFVEIQPGIQGFCRISELDDGFVENVESICKVGDEIPVKLLAIDEQDGFKFSRKAALAELSGTDLDEISNVRSGTASDFDWKSYSYRLIGHIYACEEDYTHAIDILHTAIELSPTYEDGHYDYAQYCSQMRNKEVCLTSLEKAILYKPIYWYLAKKEHNFDPLRSEVEEILSNIATEASNRAKDSIAKSEYALNEAREAVSKARMALIISKDKSTLDSSAMIANAETRLKFAIDKVASGDYVALLDAQPIDEEACSLMNLAKVKAYGERGYYERRREEKVKNAWKKVPGAFIGWPLLFFFVFLIVGAIIETIIKAGTGKPLGKLSGDLLGLFVILCGLGLGFYIGIRNILKELK